MTGTSHPPAAEFIRVSGLALAAAGILTFAINAGLSPFLIGDASLARSAASQIFLWRQGFSAIVAILLVFGSIGLYLRQSEHLGVFGAVAFVAAAVGSMLLLANEWGQIFLVRELAIDMPEVLTRLDEAEGMGRDDLGALLALAAVTLGWLALAGVTLRAGVLSRSGPVLVIAGFFATPILGGLLPGAWGFAAGNAILGAGWLLLGRELATGAGRAVPDG